MDRYEIENITRSRLTGAAHRIDKRLVDAKCLREIVINAFAHNDYSYGMLPICEVFQNRFAVRSYGGLVPQLSIEEFFFQGVSALRNPELMRILKDLELVEGLGFGIRGITKIYSRDLFEFSENSLYITLTFDEILAKSNIESKVEIVNLMKINPKITIKDIAVHTGLSISGVAKISNNSKKREKSNTLGQAKAAKHF